MRIVSVLVLFMALSGAGCSSADQRSVANSTATPTAARLVPASPHLLSQCQRTADAVGYAVPCPTQVPAGLYPTGSVGGCSLDVVGPGGLGKCGRAWRGWVVGSSETADQHLVITASPRPLADYPRVVNGPGWYPGARVRPLRSVAVNGWRAEAIFVPPATNDGSAFAHHVVLIWTVGAHTYGVGFHNVDGIEATLRADLALVSGMKLVAPK